MNNLYMTIGVYHDKDVGVYPLTALSRKVCESKGITTFKDEGLGIPFRLETSKIGSIQLSDSNCKHKWASTIIPLEDYESNKEKYLNKLSEALYNHLKEESNKPRENFIIRVINKLRKVLTFK